MPIATTTALVLGGLAAGGQVAGAVIGSKAAKGAAKTQAKAADAQAAEITRQRERFREDFDPYRQAGTGAVRQLSEGLLGRTAAPPAPAPAAGGPTTGSGLAAVLPFASRAPSRPLASAIPRAQATAAPVDGGRVLLEAPDGSGRKLVPAHLADALMQQGARRVG